MSIEVMNSAKKALKLLEKVGSEVPIRRTFFGYKLWAQRWLWISEKKGIVTVYLASDRNSHFGGFGPCYAIDMDCHGNQHDDILPGVWESALSMWPVKNEDKAKRIWNLVIDYINKAYEQHCG